MYTLKPTTVIGHMTRPRGQAKEAAVHVVTNKNTNIKKKQEDAKGKAMPVHHAMDWQGIGIMVNGLVQLQFLSTGQCHIGKGSTANSTSSQLLDSA